MAIAITGRIPRMRNSTISLGTEMHEQAGHLLDQLDLDAMHLLEDMMRELQNYQHKTEKSSLEAAKDRKIMLLEQQNSKLQSELNKMKVISSHFTCSLFTT